MNALTKEEEAFVAFGETFPDDSVETRFAALVRRLTARVETLEDAIRDHSELVMECGSCGHETPSKDDDVCRVLGARTPSEGNEP